MAEYNTLEQMDWKDVDDLHYNPNHRDGIIMIEEFSTSRSSSHAKRRNSVYCYLFGAVFLISLMASLMHGSKSSSNVVATAPTLMMEELEGEEGEVATDLYGEESNVYEYNAKNETIVQVEEEEVSSDEEEYEEEEEASKAIIMRNSSSFTPEVAWIMSFGGSGTSYTIMNTERMTNLSTASNYGEDYDPCIPLLSDSPQGPFIRSPDRQLPEHYILTKTHCGGFCMDCPPSAYVHTDTSFLQSCRSGKKQRPSGQVVPVTYSEDIPKRAIHLIRNPFDNLVGRMHLAMKHRKSRDEVVNPVIVSNDHDGMSEWCDYLDTEYQSKEETSPLFEHDFISKYQHVPCHAEWFRYIQWHNLAYKAHTEMLQLPVHYLYYDNYTTNFKETVTELFGFLELPDETLDNEPYPWIAGKSYSHFFSIDHATQAAQMVEELALPEVWNLIQHYFEQYFDDDESANEPAPNETEEMEMQVDSDIQDDSVEYIAEDPETFLNEAEEMDDDSYMFDDSVESEDTEMQSDGSGRDGNMPVPFNVDDAENPQVVWLMSFPNSGTSYTILNVEKMTNTSTGSNYATDWDIVRPIRSEWTNGPFVHRPTQRVPGYVMTKTHCTGYCDDCPPKGYTITNTNDFANGCATAHIQNKTTGEKVEVQYDTNIPTKAIHLIRNPFDNIVSRLHLAVTRMNQLDWTEEQLNQFSNSKDGFDAWCEYMDDKYHVVEQESDYFSSAVKEMFVGLPCHADLFRYVQWHNHAVALLEEMKVPVHVLYYEDYTENYNETVSELLGFLELDAVNEPVEFIPGKSYETFYEEEQAKAALNFVKSIASPTLWSLLERYFAKWLD